MNPVSALPELLDGFNFKYKTSHSELDSCELCHQTRISNANSCRYCHASAMPEKRINLNPYGKDLKKNMNMSLNKSFNKIEGLDSNNDGMTNIKKIRAKLFPGALKPNKTKQNDYNKK